MRIDYDTVASGYDCRYSVHSYAGIERHLAAFAGAAGAVLEIGCGTGHWLATLGGQARGIAGNIAGSSAAGSPTPVTRRDPDASAKHVAGIDPSARMISRAKATAPDATLVRAAAEQLPWKTSTFDRVFCINAAHHFQDRARAIAEARRVLRPGGAVLIAGREPPSDEERWWVYDYFEETRAIDRARYPAAETLRQEMANAGLIRCESFEIERLTARFGAAEALENGVVDRRFSSQLTALSDEAFARGVARIRDDLAAAREAGRELILAADIHFEATVGWLPEQA
jgi:ubiquinone/menaquinone biosynthesis C-methylase UbiE